MGPVRHRHLVNWLSLAVALQLSVALVGLAARAGRGVDPRAGTELSAGKAQNVNILAGTEIAKRRGAPQSESPSSTTAPAAVAAAGDGPMSPPAPPQSVTTAAAPVTTAPPTSAPPTRSGPSTTGAGPRAAAPRPGAATAPAAGTGPAAAGDKGQPGTLVDPAGDTVADGSRTPSRDARADIVRAGAAYRPEGVTFALQVQRPADPRTDERWGSHSTYVQWEVDTNGDSLPDFEVQYHLVDGQNLGGSVSKPGDGGEPVCGLRAGTYGAEGYKITVDPACLGNPEAISYRATLYYDTNPSDDNAEVVTDSAPDGGWSPPVARPS